MGGLFSGSKTTTQNTTSTQKPLDFQQNQLNTLFDAAGSSFAGKQGTPYYQGSTYAGMSDAQKAANGAIGAYANGQGQQAANGINGVGQTFAGQAGQAVNTLGQAVQGYGTDPTQANLASAAAYANNPYIDAQIDASSRDVTRNLFENQLTGLDRSAVGSGNINSSRAGVAEGIMRRGASDSIADISAGIRSSAFNNGLSMAEQGRQYNLNGLSSAANTYGNMANNGASALQAGQAASYQNLNAQSAAGSQEQADRQGYADEALKQWQGQDTRDYDLQKRYAEIVGNQNWGGTTTGTSTQKTPSGGVLGGILGLASGAAGIASGLGWSPFGAAK